MKLYDFAPAPNPRRVRMFLAEKGMDIPSVQINTREQEQFGDAFRAVNPLCTVPALELDDGTCIGESVAICRYIEEIRPDPPLMGRDAKEKALVEMWNRRAEFNAVGAAGDVVRNSLPMFEDRAIAGVPAGVPQIPDLATRGRQTFARFLRHLDQRLATSAFLAGDGLSIADITAFVAIDFAKRVECGVAPDLRHVLRWFDEVAARPSAKA